MTKTRTQTRTRILICDDDPQLVALLQILLKNLNYDIAGTVTSGEAAIQQAGDISPDLVLMDIMLAGTTDGIQAASEISEKQAIPVVFMTASEDQAVFERAKITQPFGYILKPFNDNSLRIAIEMALYKDLKEKELRVARNFSRNIINSSLDMIIAVDNNRLITEFNAAAEESFGYSRADVIGKHVNLLYADVEEGRHIHEITLKNGRCVAEIHNRTQSGEIFPSLLASSILHDATGNQIGVMGISQDITELKRTQAALEISRDYARNLIDSSIDMIIAVDNDRRIIEFNRAAVEIFGYTREEMLGQQIDQLYVDPDAGSRTHELTQLQGRHVTEVQNQRKDGEIFPALLSASVLKDQNGQPIGIMGVSRDITLLKAAEERLRKSERRYRELSTQLEEANNMKELLLDVITHDLKNPAGVIEGMSKMMLAESGNNEMLSVIRESSQNLLNVIDHATALSSVTLGEELEKSDLDLARMLRDVVAEFSGDLRTAKLSVDFEIPDRLVVQAHPIIAEIFRNYISNALKYATDGHKLILQGKKLESGNVIIRVKDFGETIPVANHEEIFQRRVQLDNGTKRRGRGLGLAIARRIAMAHSGRVWVEANTPKGNSFCLELPVKN